MSRQREGDGEGCGWPGSALFSGLVVLPLTHWLAPDFMPLGAADIWSFHGTDPKAWALALLPLMAYAVILQSLVSGLAHPSRLRVRKEDDLLLRMALRASLPALVEEIAFRWLIFLGAIPFLFLMDQCTFGLLGWVHVNVLIPLADLSSGYLLTDAFHHPSGWLVGASIVTTNGTFRDGHSYQGPVGWASAWFTGLYYFGLMFTYGLLVAMAGHFVHNLIVQLVAAGIAGVRARPVDDEE